MNNKMIFKLKAIEIQTISCCNSKCIVCPWIQIKDSVPKQSMSEYIWNKVLEGISALDPDIIYPYNNNEPLMDKKIESRILDLRSVSPRSHIEISTNGLFLNEKLSTFLVNNVDSILISLFGYDETSNFDIMGKRMSYNRIKNNILELKKVNEESDSKSMINIAKLVDSPYMSNDTVLKDWILWEDEGIPVRYYKFVDRSANAGDFKQRDRTIKAYGCDYNRHIASTFIRYNGDVNFCCHDWRNEYIMGNLHENSLVDIINGEKYNRIRMMVDGIIDSDADFLCKKCVHCKTGDIKFKKTDDNDNLLR